ncbi:helix-turn-helix domain-containing protein [Pseudomonas sp. NKUCC02_KPG]|uniref:helix-turn-helix domain-containing protein n=1 Tax=Pseudomonas sp. NKUCC02_KPG TaxID=2842124 RepID=UPI00214C22C0|nr:helix-turn-helix domain-containing protein [Pseudomonas sp. NKUCC02_KPG]
MKITLRLSRNISAVNDNCSKIEPQSAAAEFNDQYWHTPHILTPGSRSNAQPGTASLYKRASDLCSLMTTKKPHLLKKHPSPNGINAISAPEATASPATRSASAQYSNSPEIWLFCSASHYLCNNSTCIQLTAIESLLVQTLSGSDERICSKQELILGIKKDTYSYSGLEMCLSRFQSKFKGAFGERLFRSVRNRGYCLVQDVQIID